MRRQSVASQLQSERDCRRWAGWMNARLEGAIARRELRPIGSGEFAERLRSGVVLWMLLETCASRGEEDQRAFSNKQRARSHFASHEASEIQISRTDLRALIK